MKRALALLAVLFLPAQAQAALFGPPQLPSSVFASLPSCTSSLLNNQYFVTDIGVAGSVWTCNGTSWDISTRVLLQRAVAAATTTSASAVALVSYTIPANLLGTNRRIYVDTYWSFTASANAKSLQERFNTTCGTSGTGYMSAAPSATQVSGRIMQTIINRTTGSQFGTGTALFGGVGLTTGAEGTSSIDTTSSTCVSVTGSVAGGETLSLDSSEFWLEP